MNPYQERIEQEAARFKWLGELVTHCPTVSFHFNDEPDVEFPDGSSMPVGYTIRIPDVCDEEQFTAPTWVECVDQARAKLRIPFQQANPG